MESKVLNFPDAMKAAEILSPYVTPDMGHMQIGEFIEKLLETMSPLDYFNLMKIVLGKSPQGESGEHLLAELSKWLTEVPLDKLLEIHSGITKHA